MRLFFFAFVVLALGQFSAKRQQRSFPLAPRLSSTRFNPLGGYRFRSVGLEECVNVPNGDNWLGRLNFYRCQAGLKAIEGSENSPDGLAHACYMANKRIVTHDSDPADPNNKAGSKGNAALLLTQSKPLLTAAIDDWLLAPFHAIGMLRPALRQVVFSYCSGEPFSFGGSYSLIPTGFLLDVISFLDVMAKPPETPVVWPGADAVTSFHSGGLETPSPFGICGWIVDHRPTKAEIAGFGLPIVVQWPDSSLGPTPTVTLTSRAQTIPVCIINSLRSKDPTNPGWETVVQSIMGDRNLVIYPSQRLENGFYTVTISRDGRELHKWTFRVYDQVVTA